MAEKDATATVADTSENESEDTLGDAGKKALDSERKARREAEARLKELEPLAQKAQALEDAQKTELERLTGRIGDLETSLSHTETWARRLEAALAKAPEGATVDIIREAAKRISGDTAEELEADAEQFMTLLVQTQTTKPGDAKPHETLSPGPARAKTTSQDPLLDTLKQKLRL